MDTSIIGRMIGKYRVIEPIGGGGVSTVYKAYQPDLDRYVALKVLSPFHADRAEFTRRFVREARAVAALQHPNILPVYDFGEHSGLRYIVMRYVEGSRTLKDEMSSPMTLMRVVDVVCQVAAALDHAHHHGIVHRDVKPSNILMDGRWALLTDFGLAKTPYDSNDLTQSGLGVGTPAYMSPEQGQALPFDHRADVYSLGVIVYEILTGDVPHNAETPFAIVLRRATEPPEMTFTRYPEVTDEVKNVVLKALAINPADRFQSAGAFACALRKAVLQSSALSEDEAARATRPAFQMQPASAGLPCKVRRFRPLKWNMRRWVAPLCAVTVVVLSALTTAYLALSSGGILTPSTLSASAQATAALPVETLSPQRRVPDAGALPTSKSPAERMSKISADNGVLYRVKKGERQSLYVMRLTGEGRVQLSGDVSSVAGTFCGRSWRVVVQARESERTTLYLVDTDGSNREVLAEDVDEGWAHCSEDGQRVLAAWRKGATWKAIVLNVENAQRTMLAEAASALETSWDPQWRVIATLQQEGNFHVIHAIQLANHTSNRWVCDECLAELSRPFVSPNGRWLFYYTCQHPSAYSLRLADLEKGNAMQLATSFAPPTASFAPSGDRLLVNIRPAADAPFELHLLDLANGQSSLLLSGETVGGEFSPDQRRLALWLQRAGEYRLYLADSDDNSLTAIPQGGSYAEWQGFSADGKWALATFLQGHHYYIYRISTDGAQVQPVVTARQAADWYADAFFSANSDYLLVQLGYVFPQRSSMYLVNLKNSQWTELARDAEWQPAAVFTADGRHVVFESNRDGHQAIYVADLEGQTIQWLVDGFAPVLGASHRVAVRYHVLPTSPTPSPTLTVDPCRSLPVAQPSSAPVATSVPLPSEDISTPEKVIIPALPTRQLPAALPSPTPAPAVPPPVAEPPSSFQVPEETVGLPQPSPVPFAPPVDSPTLTLETFAPSSNPPGQSITLGLRNVWGAPNEVYEFLCSVYAPDGSVAVTSGMIRGDAWSYLFYPDQFTGAALPIGGNYELVCTVAGQQVADRFFVDEGIRDAATGDGQALEP